MRIFIALLLLVYSGFALAVDSISGSKSAYHYDASVKLSPAPAGYTPFYISYIGRHGSRYISKPKDEQAVLKVLLLAKQQNQLTPVGESLLVQLNSISALNAGHYGALTELGKHDIRQIAERMLKRFPTVFQGNSLVILSTNVPRAMESAEIFAQPFNPYYAQLNVQQQPKHAQIWLRFFDYAPAYQHYKNSDTIRNLLNSLKKSEKMQLMNKNIADRIFSPNFQAQLASGIKTIDNSKIDTGHFVMALFAVYQESLSFTPSMLNNNRIHLDSFFTHSEKEWLTMVATAKSYLQIGPAFDINGIQIKIAAPLLREVINSADAAVQDHNVDAHFYFAHAETISPLASLLGLEGTTVAAKSLNNYANGWQAQEIIPMGANIQFIFYRSNTEAKMVLVKVLLNEKEVHLPVTTDNYPYYDWQKVKQFYINKLVTLGLDNKQDAMQWLTTVK